MPLRVTHTRLDNLGPPLKSQRKDDDWTVAPHLDILVCTLFNIRGATNTRECFRACAVCYRQGIDGMAGRARFTEGSVATPDGNSPSAYAADLGCRESDMMSGAKRPNGAEEEFAKTAVAALRGEDVLNLTPARWLALIRCEK
eukprot:1688465-Pyramimonas_sp.AAC.1